MRKSTIQSPMWVGVLAAAALASPPGTARSQIFTKLTTVSAPGNPIVADPGAEANSYAGASWADFDHDGLPDLFVNRRGLYRNLGGGQFERYADGPTGDGRSRGNSWADIDRDGDLDVIVSGGTGIVDPPEKGSFLFRNDNGVFVKELRGAMADSLANAGWGCAFADYDVDGHIDFVITSANNFTGTNENRLLHNRGDGTFEHDFTTDVTSGRDTYTCPTWSDFDLDGDPDLAIGAGPADGTLDFDYWYRNSTRENGSPGLARILAQQPASDLRDGQIWNWVDIDNDGDLDVFVTSYGGLAPVVNDLYRNGGGIFQKQTAAQAGSIVTDAAKSLASVWGDFDLDGDQDVFVTNDLSSPVQFYRNNGAGFFTREFLGTLTSDAGPHFGACTADYDKDGDLDLFVNGPASRKALFRNDSPPGAHWAEFALQGALSNTAAIGTRVRVKAMIGGVPRWQLREVSAQNTFNGHNDLTVHFGLADAPVIDSLVVEWPNGLVEVKTQVVVNVCRTLVEGAVDSTPVVLAAPMATFSDGLLRLVWRIGFQISSPLTIERAIALREGSVEAADWEARRVVTASGPGELRVEDGDLQPGLSYRYRVSWWVDGVQNTSADVRVDIPGVRFGLRLAGRSVGSGLPDLELTLPRPGAVRILVADAAGRTVMHETRGASRPGPLRVPLGGGMNIANGVYFARAEFQGDVRSVRFTIVR